MIDTTHSVSLKVRTQRLVIDASKHFKQGAIAKQCGLSDAWLSRFKHNKIDNPGIDDVQRLHDYLISLKY